MYVEHGVGLYRSDRYLSLNKGLGGGGPEPWFISQMLVTIEGDHLQEEDDLPIERRSPCPPLSSLPTSLRSVGGLVISPLCVSSPSMSVQELLSKPSLRWGAHRRSSRAPTPSNKR